MFGRLLKILLFLAGVLTFSNKLLQWALLDRIQKRELAEGASSDDADGKQEGVLHRLQDRIGGFKKRGITLVGGADGPTAIYIAKKK